jgi:hypothetical protein
VELAVGQLQQNILRVPEIPRSIFLAPRCFQWVKKEDRGGNMELIRRLSSIFENPLALLFLFRDKGLGGDSSGSYCHPLQIAESQK